MRLLTVTTDYPPNIIGGAGVYAGRITDELSALGWDITVATTASAPQANEDLSDGPHIVRIKADGPPTPPVINSWNAMQVLQDNTFLAAGIGALSGPFDVISCHDVYSAMACVAYMSLHNFDTPMVLTKHTGPRLDASTSGASRDEVAIRMRSYHATSERWLFDKAARIIAVSEDVYNRIEQIETAARWSSVTTVVRPAVDPAATPQVDAPPSWAWCHHTHSNHLLVPGRLVWTKGGDVALRALAASPSTIRQCLTFVGKGDYESELRRLARELSILDRVHFIDQIAHREMRAAFAGADVVIVPSRYEPFGMVVAEAMAAGAFVAGSNVGGIAAQIAPQRNGALFDVGSVPQLVDILLQFDADPRAAAILANRAKLDAEQYGWAEAAMETHKVLLAAINAKAPNNNQPDERHQ